MQQLKNQLFLIGGMSDGGVIVKNRRLINLAGLMFLILFSGVIRANDFAFYSTVQKVFRTQGLHVSYDNMKFVNDGDKRHFLLNLDARRSDIDRVMLVGFYASGVAIRKTDYNFDAVNSFYEFGQHRRFVNRAWADMAADEIVVYIQVLQFQVKIGHGN